MSIPTLEAVEATELVISWLAEHPEQHEQKTWWTGSDDEWLSYDGPDVIRQPVRNVSGGSENLLRSGAEAKLDDLINCGTACCFAGSLGLHLVGPLYAVASNDFVAVKIGDDFLRVDQWVADYLGIPQMVGSMYYGRHPFDSDNSIEDLQSFARWLRHCHENEYDAVTAMHSEFGISWYDMMADT